MSKVVSERSVVLRYFPVIILGVALAFVLYVLVARSLSTEGEPRGGTKILPLSEVTEVSDDWILVSDLELVDRQRSMYTGQIRRSKETNTNANMIGFMVAGSCGPGIQKFPLRGEKVRIYFTYLRAAGGLGSITSGYGSAIKLIATDCLP